tara:strand:+ start:473 stop:1012 length:540 start_codon:yes stop_codon:yes gene_type:complete
MSYVVDCEKCGKPFTKFSMRSTERRCNDCLPFKLKDKNRYNQDKKKLNRELTAQSKLLIKINDLESELKFIRETKEMSYEVVMAEMRMNMKEMIREIIEAYLFDTRKLIDDNQKKTTEIIQKELKETRFKTQGSLATINSRMKRNFDAIEHDIQRIFKKTKIKLSTSVNKEREKRYGRR